MWLKKQNPEIPPIFQHMNERLGIIRTNTPDLFPDLSSAKELFAVSDYSNDDGKDTYQVITFFISDFGNAQKFFDAREEFRHSKIDFVRDFQFKKLRTNKDRERLRLLDQFLETFDSIHGIIVTVLVHKDIEFLFGEPCDSLLESEGLGSWKPHIAEKLLRILHFQALFTFGLSQPNQKYLWMTDRDAITKQMDNLGEIAQRVFNQYAHHSFNPFAYAEPLGDLRSPFKDYLSIPDLVGGAILELMRDQHGVYSRENELNTMVQLKTYKILRWIYPKNKNIKHLGCRLYGAPEAPFISFFQLDKDNTDWLDI